MVIVTEMEYSRGRISLGASIVMFIQCFSRSKNGISRSGDLNIANWKDPPCSMGKSTVSMVHFQ